MTPSESQLRYLTPERAALRQLLVGRGAEGPARIEAGAKIGAGCVLFPGVRIGTGAVLEPGAVAFRDVPAGSTLRAPTPLGWQRHRTEPFLLGAEEHADSRGRLRVVELEAEVGFIARRTFSITGVPVDAVRAQHAHRSDCQVLQVVVGEMQVLLCRPNGAVSIACLVAGVALYLPPLTWCAMFGFSADAVVLVHASNPFDPNEAMELEDLEGWGVPARAADSARSVGILRHLDR